MTFKQTTCNIYTVLYRLTFQLDMIEIVTKIMFQKILYPDFTSCKRHVRLYTLQFITLKQK